MYYYGARYYDPTIGRFTTRDPERGNIMNPQSLNPYVYCMNNPLKYIDPDGLKPIDWPDEIPYRGPSKDYSEEIEEYMEEKLQEINSSSGRKHKYRTWRGIKYDAPESPINSWGVEVTGSYAFFFGQGVGHGWVRDENGNWRSYNIYQEGWGLSGGGDITIFCSSLSAEEVANSISKTYELSGGAEGIGFDIQVSLNESGDIIKFNIGYSPGLFTVVYWDYVKTSSKGLISWLKDIF